MRTLSDLGDLAGKRVLLRCDFNVPMDNGAISDDGRIRAALPTIKKLIELGASVLICSHLGRPDGQANKEFTLAPVAARLGELLGRKVVFATDTIGDKAREVVSSLASGEIAVLENLRFAEAETSKDSELRMAFAKELASLGDAYVSDGFGVVHRKHASVYELATLLPSAAGFLVETEVKVLEQLTSSDQRPYTVVLGGSKVSDKLAVIGSLLPKIDSLVVGGGMLFTFLAAKGYEVASSLLEKDQIPTVKQYIQQAEALGVRIILPTDIRMASGFSPDAQVEIAAIDALNKTSFGENGIGLDIGPDSEQVFSAVILESKVCFWNGPMGVFEMEAFASGTRAIASALTRVQGLSVVGGGDSASAVRTLGFAESDFSHISTGGGASLEYLEGRSLPGLEVLK